MVEVEGSVEVEPPEGAVVEPELSGALAGKSLRWQVLALAGWPLLQQLMGFLVGFVDTAVAGRVSVPATNAIAVAAYMQWFMGLMFGAVGVGGTALVARATGAGNRAGAEAALGQAVRLAVVVGVVVTGVIWVMAEPIGRAAGLSGESLALAVMYLRITSLAAVGGSVLMVGGECLSGAGDTRSPFGVMLVVNAINAVLTLWLALPAWTLGGVDIPGLGWGVRGIAVGTAAAWAVGGILMLGVLARGTRGLRLHPRYLKADWPLARRELRLGTPNFLERLGQWSGNFGVIAVVGVIAVAQAEQGAHIIAIRIESLSFLPALAFATAASTLTGQYLGAGSKTRARQAAMVAWAMGAGLMAVMGIAFVTIPRTLCRIMTDQPVLIELAADPVRMCGYVQVFFASSLVLGGAMRGAGDTRTPMLITNVLTWFVRLPLVVLFGWVLGWGLKGVWIGLCIELTVRGITFAALFLRGKWADAVV